MKRLPWWRRPYFSRRVLEIGPGHNPFAGVTHLLERYVSDGRERGGNGYIETPSPFQEQGLALMDETSPDHWFHRWFVFSPSPELLVFEPKSVQDVRRFCSCRDGQFLQEFYGSLDFRQAQHCFRRPSKTTIFYSSKSFQVEVRDDMVDCRQEGRPCRFVGMRQALIANCNDRLRAGRVRRLPQQFPKSRDVFRKYGQYSLFVH